MSDDLPSLNPALAASVSSIVDKNAMKSLVDEMPESALAVFVSRTENGISYGVHGEATLDQILGLIEWAAKRMAWRAFTSGTYTTETDDDA